MKSKLFVLAGMILAGCASTQAVTMTPQGQYQVVSLSSEKEYSIAAAKRKAQKYCGKTKVPMITKEETIYQGVLAESVSDAVKKVGDVIWGTGEKDAAQTNQILRSASSDEDYKTTIEFECK